MIFGVKNDQSGQRSYGDNLGFFDLKREAEIGLYFREDIELFGSQVLRSHSYRVIDRLFLLIFPQLLVIQ